MEKTLVQMMATMLRNGVMGECSTVRGEAGFSLEGVRVAKKTLW